MATHVKYKAKDDFDKYFDEKIWSLIPEIYKLEDGSDRNLSKGTLRALVQILANQAAVLRRSQDDLWNDQFISLCHEWAVPYLADLLGTRLISSFNQRRRIVVAKEVYFRRRNGTLAILEQLISDITGWEGTVKEQFKRLSRNFHGLDASPWTKAGRVTNTLPGGMPNMMNVRSSELVNGPFDEFNHLPDVRRPRGSKGWYGIHKITFHLFRIYAYEVEGAQPFVAGGAANKRHCWFDPSGRKIQLYMPRTRKHISGGQINWTNWQSAQEWELPAPISCRLLNNEEYEIKEKDINALNLGTQAIVNGLKSITNIRYSTKSLLKTWIKALPGGNPFINNLSRWHGLLKESIIEDCGKNKLLPNALSIFSPDEVPKEKIISGILSNEPKAPQDYLIILDPTKGEFILRKDPENIKVNYHYGLSGPIGAGTYSRSYSHQSTISNPISGSIINSNNLNHIDKVNVIDDNRTYELDADKLSIRKLVFLSSNQKRPYVKIINKDWRLKSSSSGNAKLCIDGIWFGCDQPRSIRIQGNFEKLVIKNCTLDPGGDTTVNGQDIHPVSLEINGYVENLCIENSILGPILCKSNISGGVSSVAFIENLEIKDSIVQSTDINTPAIKSKKGETRIVRSTIMGSVELHRLLASTSIFTQTVIVEDLQNSCFRYSVAPNRLGTRLPKPFPYAAIQDAQFQNWINSFRFGDANYAQLSENAPKYFLRGSEIGSELGAFSRFNYSIKLDDLESKVFEYMPVGLLPHFINET